MRVILGSRFETMNKMQTWHSRISESGERARQQQKYKNQKPNKHTNKQKMSSSLDIMWICQRLQGLD